MIFSASLQEVSNWFNELFPEPSDILKSNTSEEIKLLLRLFILLRAICRKRNSSKHFIAYLQFTQYQFKITFKTLIERPITQGLTLREEWLYFELTKGVDHITLQLRNAVSQKQYLPISHCFQQLVVLSKQFLQQTSVGVL